MSFFLTAIEKLVSLFFSPNLHRHDASLEERIVQDVRRGRERYR